MLHRVQEVTMPAITVDDVTILPRVSSSATPREVVSITTAPRGFEGEGFPVRRAFAGVPLEHLDPFIHMDQMGEVDYAAGEPKGTPWHPHRGFETVTYIIDGTFEHSDSHGGGGLITNGDTQWMTAGSGLLHIERPPEDLVASGGLFHGIQLWVNLPRAAEDCPPRYQDLRASQVGLATTGRRRCADPGHRRRDRRDQRTRDHHHPHLDGARLRVEGCTGAAAVAPGLQRLAVRARRTRRGQRHPDP
jgi:redox-sensitive bicupin YhaK (pirin superfamily)